MTKISKLSREVDMERRTRTAARQTIGGYFDVFPDSTESARNILPIIFQIVGKPNSLLDVCGGIGSWCQVAKELGVGRVTCVDHPMVAKERLLVDRSDFVSCDLSVDMPMPIESELAICMEGAEHLPAEQSESLVLFLTESAPIVIFSASIPGQPGSGHINERPPLFWKNLFAEYGYSCWDLVRPRILDNMAIPYWYRQNTFILAHPTTAKTFSIKVASYEDIPDDFELVHESVLRRYRAATQVPGVRRWLRTLPSVLSGAWARYSK